MQKKRIIVGISGASGAPLAIELLRQLQGIPEVESHLICSKCGEITVVHETGLTMQDVVGLADYFYPNDALGAAPASGSFRTMGMVVIPCSMKTIAGIVTGYSDTLLLRAADVTMKERRSLVLVPRECPFSTLHLRNLTTASELGAMILPPVPAYYRHCETIAEVNRHIAGKILSHFQLTDELCYEWEGM